MHRSGGEAGGSRCGVSATHTQRVVVRPRTAPRGGHGELRTARRMLGSPHLGPSDGHRRGRDRGSASPLLGWDGVHDLCLRLTVASSSIVRSARLL